MIIFILQTSHFRRNKSNIFSVNGLKKQTLIMCNAQSTQLEMREQQPVGSSA